VKFRFSANRGGANFLCKLDGNPFAICESPKRYHVEPGQHTFKLKAVGRPDSSDVLVPGQAKVLIRRRG